MTMRDGSEYKIEAASEMIVGALPPLSKHPGEFIRETLLPEYGLTISEVARATRSNRSTLTEVLSGQRSVSHDLAYKLGALMNDAVADLLIAYQHAYDLQREQGKRDEYRRTIERRAPIGA